jgi:AcrR family transcriptional regulator
MSTTDPPKQQRLRPRKAPKQARSHATVEAITEAAARILEQHGHEGFSTNAVAERAGVSIGSLYQYFPRKDALIGALIMRETARLIEEAEAARAEPTGTAGFVALIHAAVAHQLRRPTLARLLDFEEARLPFDANTQAVKAQFENIVLDLLSRSDLHRQPDSNIAARDVMAVIKGMVDAAGEQGEIDQRQLAVRVERAVFGYLNDALT